MLTKTRILAVCAVLTVLFTMASGTAIAAIGDVWSLSGDMQTVSNPSPAVDPGSAGGGSATWAYGNVNTSVSGNLVGIVNLEMPNEGTGWYNSGASHIAMIRFDVDANLVAPHGTGDDKTNFTAGTVGGHTPYDSLRRDLDKC